MTSFLEEWTERKTGGVIISVSWRQKQSKVGEKMGLQRTEHQRGLMDREASHMTEVHTMSAQI